MTSNEYRDKAENLLTSWHPADMPRGIVEQAAVWAQLATAAAISEQGQAVRDGE
ncbi:hypothetical protein [Streptomyces xantholiticus]|uniref:Uncharacterized protein n=1 Tax=Streptomyces xantholiticus TaxID=68285 RepID=A0ABV1V3H4_9ACTN